MSALVTRPGGAATTDLMALRAGRPVTVMPIEAKFSGLDRSTPAWERSCACCDARIALDLSDVAALDVPTGVGVRSHLPFQVRLHLGHTVDHALVLDVVPAERALGIWYQPRSTSLVHAPSW